jgi:class 3 adenylate cyclase
MDRFKAGERRTVTVVFSDMKDFTALSERLDPEEMDGLMNTVFSRFEAAVRRYGGAVEKYIGDALVAVFGAPTIHEDDPARAVNAALDFVEETRKINRSLRGRDIEIGFRTAVHTGLITTGKRGDYEVVTGHAMSVASRLESGAPLNHIVVSQATKEKCETDFDFSPGYSIAAKGKKEPITAFRVEGRRTGFAAQDEPFVGRDGLVDRIFRRYIKHDSRATTGYVLTGEPGVGKTSAARQFVKRTAELPAGQPALLYARARRFRKVGFSVIIELLLSYLRFDPEADDEHRVSRLREELDIEESTARSFTRFVSGEENLDNNAFVVLYVLLGAIVKKFADNPYPVLLFIDNVHNIDRQSRDFFRFFLKNARIKPFFLLTGRETHPVLVEIFDELETLEIGPLAREDCRRLARQLWPEIAEEEVDRILAYAEGNPLFIKEYVKFVRENRDGTALPMTIQNIFLASVEKYDGEQQSLLKKLSAFSLSFNLDEARSVQEKTGGDAGMVEPVLSTFLEEGILIKEKDSYSFKHDIFRMALYDSLLNHNKKLLHGLIAEKLMQSTARDVLGVLYHLVRAEQYSTAKRLLLEEAGQVYYNTEYLPCIDAIIDNLEAEDHDSRIQCLFMKSAILFNNGRVEGADTILKQLLRLSISHKNIGFSAMAYHLLGAYNLKAYCFEKAAFCCRKALTYYKQAEDGRNQGHIRNILTHLSLIELRRNRPRRSLEHIRDMRNYQGPERRHAEPNALAEYHLLQGRYREALKVVDAVLGEIEDERSDAWFSAQFLLSRIQAQLCDFRALEQTLRRLLDFRSSHVALVSQFHGSMALCLCSREDNPDEHLRQAEYMAQQIGNDFDLALSLRTLATARHAAGDETGAEAMAREGVAIGLRHAGPDPTFSLLLLLTEISLGRKAAEDARFYLREAGFIADRGVLLDRKDRILYHFFRHRLQEGAAAESLPKSRELLAEETEELGEPRLVRNLLALRCYAEIGRHEADEA